MATLDWLCDELGVRNYIITSKRHDKTTVSQRRVIIYFYRLLGRSSVWLGRILNRDHSSILVAERNLTNDEKLKALLLAEKHKKMFGGEPIDDKVYSQIRPKVTIKVPNYHTGGIDFKEVYADEYNPSGKLPPLYNKRSGKWDL